MDSYLALLRAGFTIAATGCPTRGALLPHLFTLTGLPKKDLGGSLSAALSVGSHPPGVTRHSTLRSPDFPLQNKSTAIARLTQVRTIHRQA